MDAPDLFSLLVSPGAAVGCIVGVGIAVGLHWLFPAEDLVAAQALVVAVCCALGALMEWRRPTRHWDDD